MHVGCMGAVNLPRSCARPTFELHKITAHVPSSVSQPCHVPPTPAPHRCVTPHSLKKLCLDFCFQLPHSCSPLHGAHVDGGFCMHAPPLHPNPTPHTCTPSILPCMIDDSPCTNSPCRNRSQTTCREAKSEAAASLGGAKKLPALCKMPCSSAGSRLSGNRARPLGRPAHGFCTDFALGLHGAYIGLHGSRMGVISGTYGGMAGCRRGRRGIAMVRAFLHYIHIDDWMWGTWLNLPGR